MFKKNILLISLVTQVLISHGQQIKLTWGQEGKRDVIYNNFLKGNSDNVIKLCFENEGKSILPIMTRYNSQLIEESSNSITVEEDGVLFDRLVNVKNNLYFFTNIYDKKTKTTSFFCQPLNISTFKKEGKNLHLGTFASIKKNEQTSVKYQTSSDSSKLFMMGLSPYSKEGAEKYYLSVFDPYMEKIWDKTIELPYKDKDITILDQQVTNEGKVAIILKHYNNKTDKEDIKVNGKRVPSYITKLLLYSKSSPEPFEFIINIGDRFINDLQIASDKNNELNLFGLYREKPDGLYKGYFITKIDALTSKVNKSTITAFPDELFIQAEKDDLGSKDKKDGGLRGYSLVKYLTRENGDEDYILESRRTLVTSGRMATFKVFEDGCILDINVKKNGSTIYTRIPKKQSSINYDICSSFKALSYHDNLLIFYNDSEKNLRQKITERPEKVNLALGGSATFGGTANAVLTMATIDSNGNLTRNILMDKKQSKYITAINVAIQIADNRLALYAVNGYKDMVGYLDVK